MDFLNIYAAIYRLKLTGRREPIKFVLEGQKLGNELGNITWDRSTRTDLQTWKGEEGEYSEKEILLQRRGRESHVKAPRPFVAC